MQPREREPLLLAARESVAGENSALLLLGPKSGHADGGQRRAIGLDREALGQRGIGQRGGKIAKRQIGLLRRDEYRASGRSISPSPWGHTPATALTNVLLP